VLGAYGSRIRTIRLSEQGGPGHARNIGLAAAGGALIQYLDADDYLAPEKITRQYECMQAAGTDMCLSSWREIMQTTLVNLPMPRPVLPPVPQLLPETIRDRGWFPLMACLFRRTLLDQVGDWNTTLAWNEDREYRFRLLWLRPRISVLDSVFLYYRRHSVDARAIRLEEEAEDVTRQAINRQYFDFVSALLAGQQGVADDCLQAVRAFAVRVGLSPASPATPQTPLRTFNRTVSAALEFLRAHRVVRRNQSLSALTKWTEAWLRRIWVRFGLAGREGL
jgi:glycosyltransferase involved in cell wall biosynthesis